jgi:type IV fimbrial biogenesis protein FimT
MRTRTRQAGISLTEVMIGITVAAVLLGVGVPAMTGWLQNAQIRTASETLLGGLQIARAEAIRRNATVRFNLVDTLTATCALSASGTNWIVSIEDPTGKCNVAPSETTAPRTLQFKDGNEGSPRVAVSATGGTVVTFNALGRPSTLTANMTAIDLSNPTYSACQHAGTPGDARCLRILITTAGTARLCDPKVADATDPRKCP